MLGEAVYAINIFFRSRVSWLVVDMLMQTKTNFKLLCALSNVDGAIDGTHISIAKLKSGATDYFYYKIGGFNLNCKAVEDSKQCFF